MLVSFQKSLVLCICAILSQTGVSKAALVDITRDCFANGPPRRDHDAKPHPSFHRDVTFRSWKWLQAQLEKVNTRRTVAFSKSSPIISHNSIPSTRYSTTPSIFRPHHPLHHRSLLDHRPRPFHNRSRRHQHHNRHD